MKQNHIEIQPPKPKQYSTESELMTKNLKSFDENNTYENPIKTTFTKTNKKVNLETRVTDEEMIRSNSTITSLMNKAEALIGRYHVFHAIKLYKRALKCAIQAPNDPGVYSSSPTVILEKDNSDQREERDCISNEDYYSFSSRIRHPEEGTRDPEEKEESHNIPILLNCIGSCYFSQGEFLSAINSHNNALDYCSSAGLQMNHPIAESSNAAILNIKQILSCTQPAIALNSEGWICEVVNRYDDALKIYKEALSILKLSFGDQHPLVASALNKIGTVYWRKGEYRIALRLLMDALQIFDLTLGGKHLSNADVLCNLGNVYLAIGNFSNAMKSFQRGFSILKVMLGDNHPAVAKMLIRIGMVYDEEGKLNKAMKLYREGLTIQKQSLGNTHVDVAATLNSIGVIYEKQHKFTKSLMSYEEALHIYTKELNERSVDVAVTLNNIGEVHRHLRKYDDAMGAYQKALTIMTDVLGKNHRNVAATLHNIALIHFCKGEYTQAIELYRRVLSIQRLALGEEHPDIAVTLSNMGEVYEERGDNTTNPQEAKNNYHKSVRLYKKALRVRRASLGSNHFFIAVTLHKLGEFYHEKDINFSKALRRFKEALKVYRTNFFDDEHPYVREVVDYITIIQSSMLSSNSSDFCQHSSESSSVYEED